MKVLDADDSPLVGKGGVKEVRDIVQFVPLRDYADITLLAKVWYGMAWYLIQENDPST